MGQRSVPPRLWAVLDDACWLIFRLFGVNARPRLSGVPAADLVQESHLPWFCHRLHEARLNGTLRGARCLLDDPGNRRLPARGICASGLVFRAIPLDLGSGFTGQLILGPYLHSAPTPEGLDRACRRTGLKRSEDTEWAWGETPVLPPGSERRMLGLARGIFGTIRDRLGGTDGSATPADRLENIYPPLRLADDLPLHIYGVFLTYWEVTAQAPAPKKHRVCDLQYLDRGRARLTFDGKSFPFEPGQAVLVTPGHRISITPVERDGKCSIISASFVANAGPLQGIKGKPITLNAYQQAVLTRLCQIAAPRTEASFRSSEVKLLLVQLVLSLREPPGSGNPLSAGTQAGVPAPAPGPAGRRSRRQNVVQEIREVIEHSSEGRLRQAELAEQVRLGSRTVRRLFKAQTGMTPARYHRQLRIKRAELLLRHSTMTVARIAERLGFNSAFHFSNAFKKEMGMSPTEFSSSTRSIEQQVERARALLTEKKMPLTETAYYLGFPTVGAFTKAFRHYQGVTPEEFVRKQSG